MCIAASVCAIAGFLLSYKRHQNQGQPQEASDAMTDATGRRNLPDLRRAARKGRAGSPAPPGDCFPNPDRGTPSFITPDAVLEARDCIRTGTVFGLDYPADAFDPGMSLKRSAPRHTIYSSHPAHRDDYLDGYYLQGSTQIDGLRHRRADDVGFYNGTPDDRIREGTPDLGIQEWADNPIAGRGVLVDLDGYRAGQGDPIDHAGGEPLEPRPDPGGHRGTVASASGRATS